MSTVIDRQVPILETDDHGNEYYVYESIPILDEHERDDIVYDKNLLEKIAGNNNDRIEDTGDLVPIVEHHTPEDKDPSKDPEIVGFADRFTVKRFGKKNPRWAIYSRFRIKKEKLGVFKSRPRRSVELWPEDKPENSYIDPIALLGAETPRRDLGVVLYSKPGEKQPYRYSMGATVVPSGTNTAAPAMIETPQRNQKDEGEDMKLSPEDINALIDALRPVIQEIVGEAMVGANGDPSAQGAPPAEGMDPMAGDAPAPMAQPEGEPPIDDEEDMAAAGGMAKRFSKRCRGVDGEFDEDAGKKYIQAMDSEDRDLLARYMKHHCEDADERERYCKCSGAVGSMKKESSSGPEMYRKQNAEMASQYAKLKSENAKLRSLAAAREKEAKESARQARYSKRHASLAELAQVEGYVLDPDEEMQLCERMTEQEFDNHVEKIRVRYQKVPVGATGFESDFARPISYKKEPRSAKYAKAARDAVMTLRSKGKEVSFESVLEWMVENDSDVYNP